MKKFYIVLLSLFTALGASAQTKVATMQGMVNKATSNTATISTDWETGVEGGAVYSFDGSTFIGGISDQALKEAVNGDQIVTIAAWVYGRTTGNQCFFGYGAQNTGFKLQQNGTTISLTTKGVSDVDGVSDNRLAANQWNLIAVAMPAKTSTATQGRYYMTGTDGVYWSRNAVKLTDMALPADADKLFAIGSGNHGNAREGYNGLIANLTVITSGSLLNNREIAELVGPAPTATLAGMKAILNTKIAEAEGNVGTYYSNFDPTTATPVINAAKSVANNNEATVEQIQEAINTLAALQPIYPETGFYYLKSASNQNTENAYLTYNGTNACVEVTSTKTAKHVWYLRRVDGETCVKFMACNLDKYMQTATAPNKSSITHDFANGYGYTFTHVEDGKYIIKDGNGNVLRTENNGDVNQWSNNRNATWTIEPATDVNVIIGSALYTTICLPFDVTLPAGVEAYAITSTNSDYATLTAKTDIPANNGAILKATTDGTYPLNIATASADWTGNLLRGTTKNTYVADAAYVLSNGTNGVALYSADLNKDANGNAGSTHFLNNANKAYLPASEVPNGVNALRFDFGTATAITEIENAKQGAIYDLQGRRVEKAVKGIYIINGKKVVK